MSKLVVGNGEFLKPVNQVPLNSSFGSSLTSAITTINENFKKLISVPFLKGAHGENIQVFEIPLIDASNNNNFTKLGEALRDAIYGTSASTTTWDTSLDDPFGGDHWENEDGDPLTTHSYDLYSEDPNYSIPFYGYVERTHDKEKWILTSQQMFVFYDSRLKEIRDIKKDWKKYFVDLSGAYVINGEVEIDIATGEPIYSGTSATFFTTHKCHVIPTLYYDDDAGINEWCWSINGEKTQISAQGAKGDDGSDSSCVVCYGTLNTGSTPVRVTITEVFTDDEDNPGWETDLTHLHEGQFAIIWYEENSKLNCSFGKVSMINNVPSVYLGHDASLSQLNFDMRTLISDVDLRDLMDNITNTENTTPTSSSNVACRGLWVPDTFSSTPGTAPQDVHMFWAENPSSGASAIHSGLIDYADTHGNSSPDITVVDEKIQDDNSSFNFHYDTVKKDDIELKREDIINSYKEYTAEIDDSNSVRLKIKASSTSNASKPVTQAITTKESSSDTTRNISLSSNGLYLVGLEDKRLDSVGVKLNKVLTDCSIKIGKSSIKINGGNAPSENLSPLKGQTNVDNLKNASNINIHNQNVLLTNGNLIIGKNKHVNYINAYAQHYANYTIYNYDYASILSSYVTTNSSIYYYSEIRPRYKEYIPVSIGGWLSIYNSRTEEYSMFGTKMSEPIELSKEENFKHTFMSGKFGSTGTVLTQDMDSLSNLSLQEFNKILQIGTQNSNSDKFGVVVSMSGIWTKVGNVVDVKGKIFFSGAKVHIESGGNNKYSGTVTDTYPLSYAALYDFLTSSANNNLIKFPLPVYMYNNGSSYISTGNIYSVPDWVHAQSVASNSDYDIHENNTKVSNRTESLNNLAANDILNGEAKIHFYGHTSGVKKNLSSNGSVSLSQVSNIEVLPNIFECGASLKTVNNKYWTFASIPAPEFRDRDVSDSLQDTSVYQNATGPIKFTTDSYANSSSYSNLHFYELSRPKVATWPPYYNPSPGTIDIHVLPDNINNLYVAASIAPYLVRYMTFSFSYLLDDDTYGFEPAMNKNGNTQDYDSQSWPLPNVAPSVNSGVIANHYQNYNGNISVGGNYTGGGSFTNYTTKYYRIDKNPTGGDYDLYTANSSLASSPNTVSGSAATGSFIPKGQTTYLLLKWQIIGDNDIEVLNLTPYATSQEAEANIPSQQSYSYNVIPYNFGDTTTSFSLT